MNDIIHTTASAAEYLQRRYDMVGKNGLTLHSRTIKQWCLRGKLPGAYRIGEGRRATWQIPQLALDVLAEKKVRYKIADKTTDTGQNREDS